MRLGLASHADADTSTKHFLSSFDANAPAIVSEASISVIIRFLHKNALNNPSTFYPSAESVLCWFFKKWRSSK